MIDDASLVVTGATAVQPSFVDHAAVGRKGPGLGGVHWHGIDVSVQQERAPASRTALPPNDAGPAGIVARRGIEPGLARQGHGIDVEGIDLKADLTHLPHDDRLGRPLLTHRTRRLHQRLEQAAIGGLQAVDRREDARFSVGQGLHLPSPAGPTRPARVTTTRLFRDIPRRLFAMMTL